MLVFFLIILPSQIIQNFNLKWSWFQAFYKPIKLPVKDGGGERKALNNNANMKNTHWIMVLNVACLA